MSKKTYPIQFGTDIVVIFTVIFSIAVAGIVICFYTLGGDLQDTLKYIPDIIGATVVPLVAATTAFYIAQNVQRNTEATLLNRTMSYIERWNSPNFDKQDIIRLMREVKNLDEDKKKKKISKALQDEVLRAKLVCILNFLEEMSLAVEKDAVYEEILRDFFRGIFEAYHKNFTFWLQERSKDGAPKVYERFKDLFGEWDKQGFANIESPDKPLKSLEPNTSEKLEKSHLDYQEILKD